MTEYRCTNCRKRTTTLYMYCSKMCSWSCEAEYQKRAEACGGYHILARDIRIEELLCEVQALREEMAQRLVPA